MWRCASAFALSVVLVSLAGCRGGGQGTQGNPNLELRGRLTLPKGLPAPVVIQFWDSTGGMAAYTSAAPPKGEFYIPGPPTGPGIAPGEYKVVVVDPDSKAGIPESWQDPARTPLKVTINAQTANEIVIGQ